MDPATHDDDSVDLALSSRLLEPLRSEAAHKLRLAQDSGVPAASWQRAFDALVEAMNESERVAAVRFPGRFGRRDWASRPVRPADRDLP